MAEKGIQKAFETPGFFWLPEKREQALTGQLKHTPEEGPQITLLGSFDSSLISNFPIVHGVLDNSPCTLFNCGQSSSRSSYGGLNQAVFEADLLLVGDHVASLDEAVFGGAKIRFEGLDEWTNFSAVKIGASDGDVVKGPSRFDLITQTPITVNSDEQGGTITLCGQHSGHFGHRQIDWEYHSSFDVSSNKLASIHSLSQTFFELQHVFALLTWHRSPISYLSVFRPVENDPMNPSGKKWSGLYGHWSVGSLKDKSSTRLLTYLPHVLSDLPPIISSWFRSPPAIKASRHLFTSIIRSQRQYLQFTFLALMQTVEALHRSLDSKTYMPPVDYEAVRRNLVASIPGNVGADHRTSLESRIKYGNELSLRTRFKELFLRLPHNLRLVRD